MHGYGEVLPHWGKLGRVRVFCLCGSQIQLTDPRAKRAQTTKVLFLGRHLHFGFGVIAKLAWTAFFSECFQIKTAQSMFSTRELHASFWGEPFTSASLPWQSCLRRTASGAQPGAKAASVVCFPSERTMRQVLLGLANIKQPSLVVWIGVQACVF